MYCSHFGLHRPPFNNTPDPSFYYSTPDHEEALATLQYATLNRKGFVLITGEVGAGKTLIGRMFMRQIDRQASTAVITHTQLNSRQLLAAICSEFELDVPLDATNPQLAERLQEYLLDQFAHDRYVVVLIDEGQNLPDESFEAIRMLGNLEADDAKLLQVCILGQPELRERFKKESMRQIDQRLFRRFHLPALNHQQMVEYIQRRLSVAGCTRHDLFSITALDKVFAGSYGIPRVINQICDNALLAAYAQGHETVDEAIVTQVLEQEGLTEPSGIAQAAYGNMQTKDAATEEPYACETGFVNAHPTAQQTQARIEHIYGSSPELIEADVASPSPSTTTLADAGDLSEMGFGRDDNAPNGLCSSAFTSDPGQYPLRNVLGGAAQQWPAVRQAIDNQRKELQRAIDEVSSRCRQAQEQIESLAIASAPVAELDELRQLHASETQRVLDEITRSRTGIEQMVSQTETRIAETDAQLKSIRSTALTREAIEAVEQQQERRIQDTAARFDQYRHHIDDLVELLRRQCDQTQAGITTLAESCSRMRVELTDRMDSKLAELQRELQQQLQAASPAEQLDSLRESQARTRSELASQFETRLVELQERIQRQIGIATTQESQAIVARQTREQEQQTRQIEQKIADVHARLQEQLNAAAKAADLEAVREASARAAGIVKTELENQLQQNTRNLRGRVRQAVRGLSALRDAQENKQASLRGELQEHLATTREQLQNRLVGVSQELRTHKASVEQAHVSLTQQLEQSEARQQGLLAEHKTIIDDLARGVVRCTGQIKTITQDVTDQFAAVVSDLTTLKDGKAGVDDVKSLREEHQAAVADICNKLDTKSTELADMKSSLNGLLARASQAQAAGLQALSARLDDESRQVRQLRQRLNEMQAVMQEGMAALQKECASRVEVEELRQAHATQAAQIADEIHAGRQNMQGLIDGLTERLVAAQRKLEVLSKFVSNDSQQIGELRQTHAEDVANILQQLEQQRELTQNQFDQSVAEWTRTQQSLDTLRATAADAKALEELRNLQDSRAEEMRRIMAQQRQGLESLTQTVDQRCDALLSRLEALPSEIATADDVRAVHEENASNKAAIEAAIHSVVEQCDRTAVALQGLEGRAASRDQVEVIQQTHTRDIENIIARLEGSDSEYRRELETLENRWAEVRNELRALAQSSTSIEKFETAERQINQDMSILKQRLDEVNQRRGKDVRILVDVAQRLTDRIRTLEEMERPEPVKIELTPQVAEELGKLEKAAEQRVSELQDLLNGAGVMGEQLRASSTQVDQVLRDWLANADQIQQQSEQLQDSVRVSANVLQAMRKCHDALDSKMKSKRWQSNLAAGEKIAERLEQVAGAARKTVNELQLNLENYDQIKDGFETIAQQRIEADQVSASLAKLLAEARNSEGRLYNMTNRVGNLATGIAAKTAGLAELLGAARDFDEQQRPTGLPSTGNGNGNGRKPASKVTPVNWPKYRTHPAVQAS